MTFEEALNLCMQGAKIYRKSWDSNYRYIELAKNFSYENYNGRRIEAKLDSIGSWGLVLVKEYGVHIGWYASKDDKIANDWMTMYFKTLSERESDLIQASKCCSDEDCASCPYSHAECERAILEDAIKVIREYRRKK